MMVSSGNPKGLEGQPSAPGVAPGGRGRLRFTLGGLMRFVVYAALVGLCLRLYFGRGSSAINRGLKSLHHEDPYWGEVGQQELAALGKAAVPALLEELSSPSPIVQERAIAALGMLGPDAEPAIPILARKLSDPNAEIRRRSAMSLGPIGWMRGQVNAQAVEALGQALGDQDPNVRMAAVDSLWTLAQGDPKAVLLLGNLVRDDDMEVRRFAVQRLSSLAGLAGTLRVDILALPVADFLIEALRDEDSYVAGEAVSGLRYIGLKDTSTIPGILRVFRESESPNHRTHAAEVLGWFGPSAKAAVPILLSGLSDSSAEHYRAAVGAAIWKIEQRSDTALPLLIESLDSESGYQRGIAAEALGMIGPGAKAALPTLRARLEDPDPKVVTKARQAIEAIEPAE